MPDLKLIALDAEDLAVLSAHLQDAVLRVGDLAYLKAEQRFALVANRFDWASTAQSATKAKLEFKRRRAGLRFERVRNAQLHDVDLKNKEAALELLAICWEAGPEPPEGFVTLHFAGGGAIRLHVECIEAEMKDLGAAWTTKLKPRHPDAPPDAGSSKKTS